MVNLKLLGEYLYGLDGNAESTLRNLGTYLYGLDEPDKMQIRKGLNNGYESIVGKPVAAILRLLLDNPKPDYRSLVEQSSAILPQDSDGLYKGTVVMRNPEARAEVMAVLIGGHEPDGNIGMIRVALMNDYEPIIEALQIEYGFSEQEARGLVARATRELVYEQ